MGGFILLKMYYLGLKIKSFLSVKMKLENTVAVNFKKCATISRFLMCNGILKYMRLQLSFNYTKMILARIKM